MTFAWAIAIFVVAIVASLSGYRMGIRFAQINVAAQSVDVPSPESLSSDKQRIDFLTNSLYELTSQVDVQVGEHCLRVGEITKAIQSNTNDGSAITLDAGQQLIATNLKLQAELKEARNQIQQQREQMACWMHESRTDALTNIANRRAFNLQLSQSLNHWNEHQEVFSVVLLDIDHFKRVNDVHGHMVGDQLLKSFANCLKNNLRDTDFLARFGGEEFIVILPDTNLEDALMVAERLRSKIEYRAHRVGHSEISITASIGVNEIRAGDVESDLLNQADSALYSAKKFGRNCVFFWNGQTSSAEVSKAVLPQMEKGDCRRTDVHAFRSIDSHSLSNSA